MPTDGHANCGITDQDRLASMALSAASSGVSTSCIGFGDGYSEQLLAAMASAGRGNDHWCAGSDQAAAVFAGEFEGLASVVAQNVSVELRPSGQVMDMGTYQARYMPVRIRIMSYRLSGLVVMLTLLFSACALYEEEGEADVPVATEPRVKALNCKDANAVEECKALIDGNWVPIEFDQRGQRRTTGLVDAQIVRNDEGRRYCVRLYDDGLGYYSVGFCGATGNPQVPPVTAAPSPQPAAPQTTVWPPPGWSPCGDTGAYCPPANVGTPAPTKPQRVIVEVMCEPFAYWPDGSVSRGQIKQYWSDGTMTYGGDC